MSKKAGNPVPTKYKTRTFTKEFLRGVAWDDEPDVDILSDEIVDTSRWSIHHYVVFKYEGKVYGVGYSKGATEMQDEPPFEYDPDEIEVNELEPREVKIIEYQPIKIEE